jgi:uncharacterized protein
VFEWDADNLAKIAAHDLSSEEVESAFEDEFAMDGDLQEVDGEVRPVLFAMTRTGTVVRVIYTERRDAIRVVTAHPASRGQRVRYERRRVRMLLGGN